MKRVFFIILFWFSALCRIAAQNDTSHVGLGKSVQPAVIGHLEFYVSVNISFDPGNLTIPQTAWEENIATNGLPSNGSLAGVYYKRVSELHSIGFGYAVGFEYLPKSKGNFFMAFDIGIAKYTYGGTFTDEEVSYSLGIPNDPSSRTTNITDITSNYAFTYEVADFSWYEFYRVSKKEPISIGLGGKFSYLYHESDPGYIPGAFYMPDIFPSLSAKLRFKRIHSEKKSPSLELYFNYGFMGSSNGLASAGIQIGFVL